MKQQLFIELLSIEDAWRRILEEIPPMTLGVEEVLLEEALGRVVAEDVYSPISYPPYPRSIVDGYAVRSNDVVSAWESSPVRLRVKGELRIGSSPGSINVGVGEAVYVDTGSPIPRGADSVVPVEYTKREEGYVLVYRSTSIGENIAWPGSDVVEGELIVKTGTRLTAYHIGVLANVGVRRVKVYVKPRVAIISTGDELVEPGLKLVEGKVYDSNSFMLKALLERDGYPSTRLGIVGDRVEELVSLLSKAVREYDVIVLSGGTSAGIGDVVYKAIGLMGKIVVHGLKLKPGKPTVIGVIEGKPVFGLPGNPGSARNVYEILVRRYLRLMEGERDVELREDYVEVELALPVHGARGRRTFIPVILVENKRSGGITAYPYTYESYMIKRVLDADGLIVVDETEYAPLRPGSRVKAIVLRKPRSRVVVGEESTLLSRVSAKYGLESIQMPSTIALQALKKGDVDLAVISMLAIGVEEVEGFEIVDSIVRRTYLLSSRNTMEPLRIAWYPPGTGLSSLHGRAYEGILGKPHVRVRVRGPLHAKTLLEKGYVDYAVIPEEYVNRNLRELVVKELSLEKLVALKSK